jgi:hypothetical protein
MERIGVSKISNKVIHSTERDIISTVIERCDEDRQCTRNPKRVDVFGTGIILPGRADVSQAAAGQCRLQLCAVLGNSGIKLSEYICITMECSYHTLISGFRRDVEICALLGYYAASCGNCLPTFRVNVSVPSSRVLGLFTL